MLPIAVVDCDCLVNLTKLHDLHIFDYLQNLFKRIHIPTAVKGEYDTQTAKDPNKAWFLQKLRPNEGFYSYCTQYDTLVVTWYKSKEGIDKGEAEVIAQKMKTEARYVLSDDNKFRKALREMDSSTKVLSSIHLIAMLDLKGFLPNYRDFIQRLHAIRPFSSPQLRVAFLESSIETGIPVTKKQLDLKCNLRRLGVR